MSPNLMKDTRCRICGKDLNSVTYAKMMDHIEKHRIEREGQKSLGDFT